MFVQRVILGFVAVASTVSCVAQADLSIGSAVDSEQIKQFLESDNPRLVAWGAYFASKGDDAINGPAYVTLMSRKLGRWVEQYWRIPNQESTNVIGDRRKAMRAIFYALIEEGASVPIGSLIPSVSDFPTETLILAARLPTDEFSRFLREWCEKYGRRQNPDVIWNDSDACTPVAAMLLAKAPPPGFAAKVLNQSSEDLSFWVLDADWELSNMKGDGGESPACRGMKEDVPVPSASWALREREVAQWPPLFTYLLQNSASPYPGTLLVDAGGEVITYRRIPPFTIPTDCYPPPGEFYEDFKHHLLAEMLENDDASIPWPMRQEVAFFLHNPADFLPALKKQIEHEESGFRETVQALEDKGYLTKDEAATIQPRLQVTVKDARAGSRESQGHPPPLPVFVSKDALISVGYDKP